MKMCLDCKSTNIVDVEVYHAYFREGDYVRLRAIVVHENVNSDIEPKDFIASCPELSQTATNVGNTPEDAIKELGRLLMRMKDGRVKLLGEKIEDD